MKKFLIVIVILSLSVALSGCSTPPESETDWVGLIDSYNSEKAEFKGFSGSVVVKDEVKEVRNLGGWTEFKLKSNPDVPVYLTETREYKKEGPFLAKYYNYGDDVIFTVHIKEDQYGEYIEEIKT